MEVTERPPRPQSGPMWMLTLFVAVIALLVGAVGGSVVEPQILTTVSATKDNVSTTITSLADRFVAAVQPETTRVPTTAAPATTKPVQQAQSQTSTAPPQALTAPSDEPYIAVVEKAGPAVVTVVNQMASQPAVFGQVAQPEALGSGVIIDRDGHIVTNNHVVAGGSKFQVIFSDGRKVSAQLVGRDDLSDVAVLKVEGSVPAVASFADSSEVQVGERVVAIGSALGDFKNTVTHGIISGLDRSLADQGGPSLSGLIQTDAPINHGNSGGPLLNLQGQVIGLNTAVVRSSGLSGDVAEGLGFAIPSNTVKEISDQLIKSGYVVRPYLGVSWSPVSPQIASYYGLGATSGALIQAVEPGSPASKAGLQSGDVVTAVDGTKIDQQHDFTSILLNHKVGDKISLSVQRGQENETLTATLIERPQNTQ